MPSSSITSQRYISQELSHFVGRGVKEWDEQYEILVKKILKTGWLKHRANAKETFEFVYSGRTEWGVNPSVDTDATHSRMTCFCDIPIMDLPLHMERYSYFGLSFPKRFLITKGANPVLYVAKNTPGRLTKHGYSPLEIYPRVQLFKEVIDTFWNLYLEMGDNAKDIYEGAEGEKLRKQHYDFEVTITSFVWTQLFNYIKFFDDEADDGDESNVYMEREWRVPFDVNFTLSDVATVFLPRAYADRFRKDMPEYNGQLIFSDQI